MKGKKVTWQQYVEETNLDFELVYQKRLCGLTWEKILPKECSLYMVRKLIIDWCLDNNKDYEMIIKTNNIKRYLIDDIRIVDRGKVIALAKAGWPIKEIAIDCNCTERCAEEVINSRRKNNE